MVDPNDLIRPFPERQKPIRVSRVSQKAAEEALGQLIAEMWGDTPPSDPDKDLPEHPEQ